MRKIAITNRKDRKIRRDLENHKRLIDRLIANGMSLEEASRAAMARTRAERLFSNIRT